MATDHRSSLLPIILTAHILRFVENAADTTSHCRLQLRWWRRQGHQSMDSIFRKNQRYISYIKRHSD